MAVSEESLKCTRIAAKSAHELKATSVFAIDVSERLALAEVFLVVSGSSDRQVRSLVDEVERALHEAVGLRPVHTEGLGDARWVLLDYGDLVVHVQQDEDRDFYALDRLWGDCPSVDLAVPDGQGEAADAGAVDSGATA